MAPDSVMHRRAPARPDRGMTLIEVMVALVIIMGTISALLLIITSGMKNQVLSERVDRATGAAQVVMSKGRQAKFADLGFYATDTPPTGSVTLPISVLAPGGTAGAQLTEATVVLGALRPQGKTPFALPVDTFIKDNVDFRVATVVTWVPNPNGSTPTAKRITVVSQWAPTGGPTLTGDCTQAKTKCATQSMMRTATAADLDPVSGVSPTSTCTATAKVICEAYIRSGRVLDGATMARASDTPEQVSPVDIFVRTASTATAVTARWTWLDAAGGTVKTVTKVLVPGADGTRWTFTVPADAAGASTTYKGDIRPGRVPVTFTAVMGAAVTTTRDATWSYALDTGLNSVAASVAQAGTWCSFTGAGTPVRFAVQGLSFGFTAGTKNPTAADTVDVVFTTTTGALTKATTVPATVDPASVAVVNLYSGIDVIGGSVNATWTATPPATDRCDNRAVSVVVRRAADQTTTPVVLRLPATTPIP